MKREVYAKSTHKQKLQGFLSAHMASLYMEVVCILFQWPNV